MTVENPVDVITGTWVGVAPAGFAENVHALIQKEVVGPDGRRLITYPALVFSSVGVATLEVTPDGRRNQQVEQFLLDFRAETYQRARLLAEAFRQEVDESALEWSIEADDVGLDLVLQGGGEMVPRRVVRVTLPYRREFG